MKRQGFSAVLENFPHPFRYKPENCRSIKSCRFSFEINDQEKIQVPITVAFARIIIQPQIERELLFAQDLV